jgi:D-alanyl-D-alanine carboxypeptidase
VPRALRIILIVIASIVVLLGCAALVLYLLVPKPPRAPAAAASIDEIDAYLDALTENQTPPGLTITVLHEGRQVYQRASGFADTPRGKPARVDTIYAWWSATKPFTATAIMQLVEQGRIDLDAAVTDYLPWFTVTGSDGAPRTISIRQLLTHSSGLPDLMPEGLSWIRLAGEPAINQTIFVQTFLNGRFRELRYEPGTDTRYTNIGFIVLGAVVEAVTGRTYESYIDRYILRPLNMSDTAFVRGAEQQGRTATPSNPVINIFTVLLRIYGGKELMDTYVRESVDGRIWFHPLYTNYTPSTGLSGTSGDLARFGQAILEGGELDGERILGQSTVDVMLAHEPVAALPDTHDAQSFCLGWRVWRMDDKVVVGHGGGGPGYGALLALIPERELVVTIDANDTNIDRDTLLRFLASYEWQ